MIKERVAAIGFCVCVNVCIVNVAIAGGIMVCKYPNTCRKIVSSEYSTGGGDKIVQYMEMDCVTENGSYIKYIDRIGSIGGAFGLGRFTQPNKVLFEPWRRDELQCKK